MKVCVLICDLNIEVYANVGVAVDVMTKRFNRVCDSSYEDEFGGCIYVFEKEKKTYKLYVRKVLD